MAKRPLQLKGLDKTESEETSREQRQRPEERKFWSDQSVVMHRNGMGMAKAWSVTSKQITRG